ncbi:MAG: bifunctional UDP-N-acetylglucosamine diphosphorylase/glucosamine-1-phosphate N-acetyltransferase GlmU [Oscillospiraceae bacterium]|nr:bifunctional UDP-N-acetylglucosamine diphosphorylase/glucosamine-1-phosphate N-acetyltransferase GlmU [Oscillospiraceae bacterium]
MQQSILKLNSVILAAGEGKRMHSTSSKVLCEVAFKPMLAWVVDAAKTAGIEDICVVANSDDVRQAADGCTICEQKERLGTGHAVMCAKGFLEARADGNTLVLCGDAPFIDADTIARSLDEHIQNANAVTCISAVVSDPTGYGRIVRREGRLAAIVEQADCNDATAVICEINSGAYWFRTDALLEALGAIKNDNAQGEYYLTDAVAILIKSGGRAGCFTAASADVALGANRPIDLLNLNDIASERAIARHLDNGVRFVKRDGIIIGPDVVIEPGAVIMPGTILYGKTFIGAGAVIGPNSLVSSSSIGAGTHFNSSQAYNCTVGRRATIGPYVQIRPDSVIDDKVKIGDFVEVKNSHIGEGTSVAHLTYVGDADVGKHCNFGCGVVFVNYDGEKKSRTVVKDYAFIGCNNNLIAPVTVGEAAYTAAGATITKDVPDGALAVGRPETRVIEGWAARKLKKYIEKQNKK